MFLLIAGRVVASLYAVSFSSLTRLLITTVLCVLSSSLYLCTHQDFMVKDAVSLKWFSIMIYVVACFGNIRAPLMSSFFTAGTSCFDDDFSPEQFFLIGASMVAVPQLIFLCATIVRVPPLLVLLGNTLVAMPHLNDGNVALVCLHARACPNARGGSHACITHPWCDGDDVTGAVWPVLLWDRCCTAC